MVSVPQKNLEIVRVARRHNGRRHMKYLIKLAATVLLCIVCMAAAGIAETKYVVEEFEITMRTGPGVEHKIIALIRSGDQVEVIQPGDEWTEVRLPNGKQGWVLTRYLTSELPSDIKLESLEKKYQQLLSKNVSLEQSVSELGGTKKELTTALSQTQTELADVTKAHEILKKGSSDFINLKKKYDIAVNDLAETTKRADQAESEVNRLSNNQVYKGMLYGAGLLAIGFIVGFIVKKPKRKSQLM
jgi:SH3 domain protein